MATGLCCLYTVQKPPSRRGERLGEEGRNGRVRACPGTIFAFVGFIGVLGIYGKIPRSFFAPTTRLSADMYAPIRREARFSAASAQTSSKA